MAKVIDAVRDQQIEAAAAAAALPPPLAVRVVCEAAAQTDMVMASMHSARYQAEEAGGQHAHRYGHQYGDPHYYDATGGGQPAAFHHMQRHSQRLVRRSIRVDEEYQEEEYEQRFEPQYGVVGGGLGSNRQHQHQQQQGGFVTAPASAERTFKRRRVTQQFEVMQQVGHVDQAAAATLPPAATTHRAAAASPAGQARLKPAVAGLAIGLSADRSATPRGAARGSGGKARQQKAPTPVPQTAARKGAGSVKGITPGSSPSDLGGGSSAGGGGSNPPSQQQNGGGGWIQRKRGSPAAAAGVTTRATRAAAAAASNHGSQQRPSSGLQGRACPGAGAAEAPALPPAVRGSKQPPAAAGRQRSGGVLARMGGGEAAAPGTAAAVPATASGAKPRLRSATAILAGAGWPGRQSRSLLLPPASAAAPTAARPGQPMPSPPPAAPWVTAKASAAKPPPGPQITADLRSADQIDSLSDQELEVDDDELAREVAERMSRHRSRRMRKLL